MKRLLLTTVLGLAALPAQAENLALLIGANTYPNLDEQFWLKGPSNDVALVETYLTTAAPVPFAPGNVIVLADGLPERDAPTLAAIRSAFADLASRAGPGDFVYLHFSGHGSQAPAKDPATELDGLDELFLPVDIGAWDDSVGEVHNALVDDEIGQMIDAIRAKGANVWAVFDSCHSGTVTRAAPSGDEQVRTRQLPPGALGLDPDAMVETTRGLPQPDARAAPEAPMDSTAENAGSFTAFFAAQTNEVTPERNLPKNKPGRVPQGVFTYTLFQTLSEYPGATYGQIGQEVLRKYSVLNLAQSTPLFEGDMDRVVFQGEPGPRVAQWAATVQDDMFSIAAGTLHGLTPGAQLAVMASAADATENALGTVILATADTFTATANVGTGLPNPLPRGLTLREIEAPVDYTLTVALPIAGTIPADALQTALDALTEITGPRLAFVAPGAEADLRLAVIPDSPRPDAIWVLNGTGLAGDLSQTPSVSTADKDAPALAQALGDTLTTMARAINLLKLGDRVGAGSMDVSVQLQTRQGRGQPLVALSRDSVPRLVPDDEVHVLAKNNTDAPVDVNVLYVAANYQISHWFSGRLQPGDQLKQGLFKISDDVLGAERMIVVVTPAKPQSPVEDLSFLAQDEVVLTRGTASSLANALNDAGFGVTTRGAVALDDDDGPAGPTPGVIQIELRTVPAD